MKTVTCDRCGKEIQSMARSTTYTLDTLDKTKLINPRMYEFSSDADLCNDCKTIITKLFAEFMCSGKEQE